MIVSLPIEQNTDLTPYNTFAIKVYAKLFARVKQVSDLFALKPIIEPLEQVMVLGGGSNVLFLDNFKGLVIKNEITGIDIIEESEDHALVRFGAGENWHHCVCHCIAHAWYGIENLSLIPGTAGAAPIQNIGAYGVELQEVFYCLEAVNLDTMQTHTFYREDCGFSYRDSIFKHRYKGQFMITAVVLNLSKTPYYNLAYAPLAQHFSNGDTVNLRNVANAVIAIRQSKLPDPHVIPNAGSFFKNPIITRAHYYRLKMSYSQMPHYKMDDNHFKIPAAWLIEQTHFKGKRLAHAGVHDQQALVLINHDHASGQEILDLAQTIRRRVFEKFAIHLEYEVNII
jgi:UDP-N-acetylmuramate dehydrogenase